MKRISERSHSNSGRRDLDHVGRFNCLLPCRKLPGVLNLRRAAKTSQLGRGIFITDFTWSAAMPKAARIPTSVPVSSETEQSDTGQFVSVALFSGIGLLISLIAVILGINGVWS